VRLPPQHRFMDGRVTGERSDAVPSGGYARP
jgi:hypothetical protein